MLYIAELYEYDINEQEMKVTPQDLVNYIIRSIELNKKYILYRRITYIRDKQTRNESYVTT